MSNGSTARGLRERIGAEDRLGKALSELLENPLLTGAVGRAFDAREKAAQAQEVAMGALNLPSASDIERLTRRLRSVSQRLEGIEDGVHRLDRGAPSNAPVEDRLRSIEEQLRLLTVAVQELNERLPGSRSTISHAQERLRVEDTEPAPAKPRKAAPKRAAGRSPSKRTSAKR